MALTEDDREWLGLRLQEFVAKVELNLDAKIEKLEVRIDAKIKNLEAKIEKVEASLLTAFHKWASPFETRQRTHSMAMRTIDEEVDLLKDRVSRLEQRA